MAQGEIQTHKVIMLFKYFLAYVHITVASNLWRAMLPDYCIASLGSCLLPQQIKMQRKGKLKITNNNYASQSVNVLYNY